MLVALAVPQLLFAQSEQDEGREPGPEQQEVVQEVDPAPQPIEPPVEQPVAGPITEPQPEKPAAKKVGPFKLFDDDQTSIKLGLLVQMYFNYMRKDNGDDAEDSSFLGFRRIRPTLAGQLLDPKINYYLHLSTAPGSIELIDYYVNYVASDDLHLRIGQYKTPFTRYRIQSGKRLTLVDWSIVTKYFGSERQTGISLHNGYEKPSAIEYVLGVFSGYNMRKSHATGLARIYGEKSGNISDLVNPAERGEIHPEIFGRFAYNYGGIKVNTDTDFAGGAPRFSLGLNAAWDNNPVRMHDFSLRLAPELLVKAYGISFAAIYYLGYVEEMKGDEVQTGDTHTYKPAMTGHLIQASYLFCERYEIALRYARIGFGGDITEEARDRAAALIEAEPEGSEARSDVENQYESAGMTLREEELVAGVNIYLVGTSLKLQSDITALIHTRYRDEDRTDVRVRSMLQLAF
jgi:phosphate-selective porin O/P